jgi:RNA polymerase primary sigma factor
MQAICAQCGYSPQEGVTISKCPACGGKMVLIDSRPFRIPEPEDESNTIALYFREIDRTPLLTAEEEQELARQIEVANRARQQLQEQDAVDEEVRQALEAAIAAGERARQHMIKANTRLVVSIAKKYMRQGVPLSDLIQEGNLGLLQAVERFDPDRGTRFATYATWWIRQAVARALGEQATAVRLPAHILQERRRLYRIRNQLRQELGRNPTIQEIADQANITSEKVELVLHGWRDTLSLEEMTFNGAEEEGNWGEFLEDSTLPQPAEEVLDAQLRGEIEDVFQGLTPREARVLEMRYGLKGGEERRLVDIAKHFELTRERIRQIEGDALRKLRKGRRSQRLKEFYAG